MKFIAALLLELVSMVIALVALPFALVSDSLLDLASFVGACADKTVE